MNGFIGQLYDNLKTVDREALIGLYEMLRPEGGVVGIYVMGDGRSLKGITIGTHELSFLDNYRIAGIGESYPFGNNIISAFTNLNKCCDKSCFLVGSGSGESFIPKEHAKRLKAGIDNGAVKAKMGLITSYPDSSIGKIVQALGEDGVILKLVGRHSKDGKNEQYLKEGILEDELELEMTKLLSTVSSGIGHDIEPDAFYGHFIERLGELQKTADVIRKAKETEAYRALLDGLFDPTMNSFICGENVSDNIAKMANIRNNHVRPHTVGTLGIEPSQAIIIGANRNYVIGESSTPNISKNSVVIGISRTGTSPKTQHYLGDAKTVGAETFLITGTYDSELAKNVDYAIVLDSPDPYTDYCIFLSELLTDLGYELVKAGIPVDEQTFKMIHVRDKAKAK